MINLFNNLFCLFAWRNPIFKWNYLINDYFRIMLVNVKSNSGGTHLFYLNLDYYFIYFIDFILYNVLN